MSGNVYVSDALAAKMLQHQVRGRQDIEQSPVKGLSDREMEVFQLIGQWKKTREIAHELHLSIKTIEYYREQIKQKLDLKKSAELPNMLPHGCSGETRLSQGLMRLLPDHPMGRR